MFDTDDNPVTEERCTIDYAEVQTRTRRIDCRAGKYLRCETVGDLAVEAKHIDVVTWTDIETTPLLLTSWDGTRQSFQIRFTAGTLAASARRSFRIYVQ